MLSTYLQDKRDEEGFTLIELLVVVIIIGILAAIAIPVFLSQREKAWDSAAQSSLRSVGVAQESLRTEQGSYASSLEPLADYGAPSSVPPAVDGEFPESGVFISITGGGEEYCAQAQHTSGGTDNIWSVSEDGAAATRGAC